MLRHLLPLFFVPSWILAAQPVSVGSLVTKTLASHPEIEYYRSEIAAAQGGVRTAGTVENPQLQTTFGTWRVRDLDSGGRADGPAWTVTLSQTFEWPGRIALRKAVAQKEIELAELGLEQMRLALAGEVRVLAWRLMAANQRVRVADEVSARFRNLSEVLLQRDPAGAAPRLEARLIQASAMTLGAQATAARRERAEAQFALNQLLGNAPEAELEIVEENLELRPPADLSRLLELARERNFGLRERIASVEQQGFAVALAKNDRWPAITVAPYLGRQTSFSRETTAGIGVSVPLPLWNHNKGEIQVAQARLAQAEVLLRSSLRQLERDVANHASSYRIYAEELTRWPGDTLADFRQSAEEADEHYRLGALSVGTYTELQKQYIESVNTVLDNQIGALEARMQLEQLTGESLNGDEPTRPPVGQ